ncbi:MAG: restriction endonuclease subunit S [Prevotella sp.]|nr:restriction endonuclease subunit S [Prevotella sp.]
MSEWKKVKLGDICERVTSGGTPKANVSSYYFPPIIPWLKTKEVNYCRITETENFISEEGLNNSSAKLIAPNSVIIAMYGQGDTAGRVAINKIPLTTNQACCNLTIDESKADYEFIYYQLCTLYNKMVSLKAGAAQPNLNAQIIKNLEVLLPSLPTQHRIATILSRYDSLIENYQKQIKLLEEAAQRLYKEWFVDLHFPGHENTKIVDGVPEGWEKMPVDSIYSIKYGKNLSTKLITPTGKYPVYGANGVIGYYDVANCNNQVVLITSRGNGSGDVLMTYHKDAFITNNSFVVSPLDDYSYCQLPFTYQFLKNANFRAVRTGAAQPQLTNQSIHTVDVVLPSKDIIIEYCDIVSYCNIKIVILKNQIRLLSEARDRLLPKLMSGEIDV